MTQFCVFVLKLAQAMEFLSPVVLLVCLTCASAAVRDAPRHLDELREQHSSQSSSVDDETPGFHSWTNPHYEESDANPTLHDDYEPANKLGRVILGLCI
jgi:hypothetical protein